MTHFKNGELMAGNRRWCSTCDRPHGKSFICDSYSRDLKEEIMKEDSTTSLPYGVSGNGISQIIKERTW